MKETDELVAADISNLLGRELQRRLTPDKDDKVSATASDMKVALDYIKHHGVTDDAGRPGSPVRSVEDAVRANLPFPADSVNHELPK